MPRQNDQEERLGRRNDSIAIPTDEWRAIPVFDVEDDSDDDGNEWAALRLPIQWSGEIGDFEVKAEPENDLSNVDKARECMAFSK